MTPFEEFVDVQRRRTAVDGDGWYEPCAGQPHASDARAPRALRAPISRAFAVGAPFGFDATAPLPLLMYRNRPLFSDACASGVPVDLSATVACVLEHGRVHLYRPVRASLGALCVVRWRVCANRIELALDVGRFPRSRAEFKARLADVAGGATLLQAPLSYPDDAIAGADRWFARLLDTNALDDEQRRVAFRTATCKARLRMPLVRAAPRATDWRVQTRIVRLDDRSELGLPPLHDAARFASRATRCARRGTYRTTDVRVHGRTVRCTGVAVDDSSRELWWDAEPATLDVRACAAAYVRRLFDDPARHAARTGRPARAYAREAAARAETLALDERVARRGHVTEVTLSARGAARARARVLVGAYAPCAASGGPAFAYTTDDGLRMGMPHLHCDHERRAALLARDDAPQVGWTNVLARSAIVWACGHATEVRDDGTLALEPDGPDRGARLALVAALRALRHVARASTPSERPSALVFDASDPLARAQLFAVLGACPLVGPGDEARRAEHAPLLPVGARLRRVGPGVVAELPDGRVRPLRLIERRLPPAAEAATRPARSGRRARSPIVTPLALPSGASVSLPADLAALSYFPVVLEGDDVRHVHNRRWTDSRLLLLDQPVAFRATAPLPGAPLIRPFPTDDEIERMLTFAWTQGDELFAGQTEN